MTKPIVWFLTNLNRIGTINELLFHSFFAAMKTNDKVGPGIVHQDFLITDSKIA